MPLASLVASLLLSLSNFNLSCSSCIRYFYSQYCSNMDSACSFSDLETWISLPPAVSLTVEIPYMASNCFLRYCLQWRCNFSDLFCLLYFLSSRFVSILQSFISLSFCRSQSLSSSNFVVFPVVCVSLQLLPYSYLGCLICS